MSSVHTLRHAKPLAEGICYGRSEVAVAPVSCDEVRAIVEQLRQSGSASPQVVHCSPLRRCRLLATAMADALCVPLHVDPRLAEIHMGDFEGVPWEKLRRERKVELERWMQKWEIEAPPGGEAVAELEERVRCYWDSVFRKGPGSVLTVTHAGVVRALLVIACGLSWQQAMKREVPYLCPQRLL